MPFLEALRQLIEEDVVFIHVTLVPNLTVVGERRLSQPTFCKDLREVGISPHIIVCRSTQKLNEKLRKNCPFTNVKEDHVISAPDVEDIHLYTIFNESKIGQKILDYFKIDGNPISHYGNQSYVKIIKGY